MKIQRPCVILSVVPVNDRIDTGTLEPQWKVRQQLSSIIFISFFFIFFFILFYSFFILFHTKIGNNHILLLVINRDGADLSGASFSSEFADVIFYGQFAIEGHPPRQMYLRFLGVMTWR